MNTGKKGTSVGAAYIQDNFEPADRLAVVLLNKRSGAVIQRIAAAEKIAVPDFQAWLRQMNAQRYEVYISMNALRENAYGRTKTDIGTIRHIYLDFDENGTASVDKLLKRDDLPAPNYVVSTSPDKWQVVWKVERFTKEEAEHLQRALARDSGADIAATDCARVLRLPGFYNHKYGRRHLVQAEARSLEICHPEQFPRFPSESQSRATQTAGGRLPKRTTGKLSQSEYDWAYAKRALARGESSDLVIAAIAVHRRNDKHDPRYYAELTVQKALQALAADRVRAPDNGPQR